MISTFLKVLFSTFENVLPQSANHSFWAFNLLNSFSAPAACGTAWCEAVAEFLTAALTGFRHEKGVISSLQTLPQQLLTQLEKKVGKGKGEWRPFRTQLKKRINKVHFKDLLENFLSTNKFVKEKKETNGYTIWKIPFKYFSLLFCRIIPKSILIFFSNKKITPSSFLFSFLFVLYLCLYLFGLFCFPAVTLDYL